MFRPRAQRWEQRDEIEARIRLYADQVARGEAIRYVASGIELAPRAHAAREPENNGGRLTGGHRLDRFARRLLRRILGNVRRERGLCRPMAGGGRLNPAAGAVHAQRFRSRLR